MTFNFYEIGACAVLAAFGAVSAIASLAVSALWPAVRRRLGRLAPRSRARRLLALRLLPTALALAASVSVALPSYLEFESPDTTEVPGGALEVFAVLGLVLAAVAAVRFFRVLSRTRRIVKGWSRAAPPEAVGGVTLPSVRVASAVPVVALAGWRRPVLFVADSVIEGCDPRLLGAIAAHELGHRGARDNLKRLLLASCADPLILFPVARQIAAAWEQAAEEAADDAAIASGARPEDLAEALLVVARLAPARAWPILPAAAFYQGGCLEIRVRRLIADGARRSSEPRPRWKGVLAAMALLVFWAFAAEALHRPARRLLEHATVAHPGQLRALVVVPPRA